MSDPGTPETRPATPGVRTCCPAPLPFRTCSDHSLASFSPSLGPPWGSSPIPRHAQHPRPHPRPAQFPGSALSPPPRFLSLPSTGQLSGAAAEGWERAIQMRRLRGCPDGLHPGLGSGRDAPGPGYSAPEPVRLLPEAGEGTGCSSPGLRGSWFPHLASAWALAGHSLSKTTLSCRVSFWPPVDGGPGDCGEQPCCPVSARKR